MYRIANNATSRSTRRLLVVTYQFPPVGGSGTLRALRFTRYLGASGWEPVVVTASPLPHAHLDPSLSERVPADCKVEQVYSFEPERFADSWDQPLQKVVRNLFRTFDFLLVPDDQTGWVRPARNAARRLFNEEGYDAIFTTGPPFSTHLIGLALRKQLNIPWIADFRDDWTGFNDVFRGGNARRRIAFERDLEREVLRRADVLLTINDPIRKSLQARMPSARIEVIPNGFDPADFERLDIHPPAQGPFTICHMGTLYEQRSPAPLLDAVRLLRSEGVGPDALQLHFYGRAVGPVNGMLAAPDLADMVHAHGIVSHRESVEAMMASQCLLLIIDQVELAEQIWTGKVFEYLAARRPILALMPRETSLAGILANDSDRHRVLTSNEPRRIADAIRQLQAAPLDPLPDSHVATRHRADNLTAALARLLDGLAAQPQMHLAVEGGRG